MAHARLASWLAAAASLLFVPAASGWAQIVSGPLPMSTEPIILGEFPPGLLGVPIDSWAGPSFVVGPGGGLVNPNAASDDSSVRSRRRGDLLWKTLHDRGWQALRSFVPNDEARTRNLDTAERLFRAALQRLEPYEPGDGRVAVNYSDLAWVFLLQKRYDEARTLASWALSDRETRLGAYDPQVGDNLILMTRIAIAEERFDEAEDLAQRALRAYVRSSPGRQTDLHTPIALDALGSIASAQSRLEVAEAYIRRAFEWRQEVYDFGLYAPDKDIQVIVELARSNVALADVLKKLGRDQEAEILEDQARYLLESAAGGPAQAAPGAGRAPGPGL